MPRARKELSEIVAIRSVADPRQFPPEECLQATAWVADQFARRRLRRHRACRDTRREQRVIGSRPCRDRDAPTVLLSAHYDVQPPLNQDAWRTPLVRLTEVDGRWYGRGATDCKGNLLMHLTALRALGGDDAGFGNTKLRPSPAARQRTRTGRIRTSRSGAARPLLPRVHRGQARPGNLTRRG